MALTISQDYTQKFQGSKRVFKFITVTHDATESDITGASLGLEYIDFAMQGGMYSASEPANVSVMLQADFVTVLAKKNLMWAVPSAKAGSKSKLIVIGW